MDKFKTTNHFHINQLFMFFGFGSGNAGSNLIYLLLLCARFSVY